MGIIREKKYAHYFLVVADIARRAKQSCGRGSAAASIVSYALGITHVDPVAHNLFFERFLNPDRMDPPDIDVDFAWDERDQIIDYVFSRYGTRRAAMVANHNTFAARSAMREVAKVLGLTDEEIGRVTKNMASCGTWEKSGKPCRSIRGCVGLTSPDPGMRSLKYSRSAGVPFQPSFHPLRWPGSGAR